MSLSPAVTNLTVESALANSFSLSYQCLLDMLCCQNVHLLDFLPNYYYNGYDADDADGGGVGGDY